jgi:hypothetical protein
VASACASWPMGRPRPDSWRCRGFTWKSAASFTWDGNTLVRWGCPPGERMRCAGLERARGASGWMGRRGRATTKTTLRSAPPASLKLEPATHMISPGAAPGPLLGWWSCLGVSLLSWLYGSSFASLESNQSKQQQHGMLAKDSLTVNGGGTIELSHLGCRTRVSPTKPSKKVFDRFEIHSGGSCWWWPWPTPRACAWGSCRRAPGHPRA